MDACLAPEFFLFPRARPPCLNTEPSVYVFASSQCERSVSELGKWLGRRIRELRTQRAEQWSQGDLARRAKISPSYLSMIERGQRVPNLETLAVVARALGVPFAELLAGMEEKRTSDR